MTVHHPPMRRPEGGFSTRSDRSSSTVDVHPEWASAGGTSAWLGPRDMAFVEVDEHIPVWDEDGTRISVFRRPIDTVTPVTAADPIVDPSTEAFSQRAFCGWGPTGAQLRCDDLSNLWFTPTFRHQFLQIPFAAFDGMYEGGDRASLRWTLRALSGDGLGSLSSSLTTGAYTYCADGTHSPGVARDLALYCSQSPVNVPSERAADEITGCAFYLRCFEHSRRLRVRG